ncbi:thiolase domain-containing protein [Halomarina litorea]|uniref:thiolase domain-containing protein n=1 Tax=Halomarina litorea TaxID=2961595 RepID=UPI0020C2D7FB|nr:thiolase domain-containing protein [Halomarina sp. BCD28]
MSGVRVAGTGLTKFGQFPERTGRDLFAEAGLAAIDEAGIDPTAVEHLYFGNFMGELAEHQGHQGPLMAEAIGVTAPATRLETACASAGVAVREAVKTVRSGEADVVVAGGMERMTNLGTARATEGLAIAADDLYEIRGGMTFPAAYALMAQAYFDEFGGDAEDLAHVAVKNHDNALPNEHAQFRNAITVEDVLDAPRIADPIGLYDACPITDGAAAIVVVSEDFADREGIDAGVAVTGSGQGGDNLALQDRKHLARSPAATKAAEMAYEDADIGPEDVDVAEVHDCFTIAEVMAIESLGFYEPGEGIGAARRGETTRDGDLPVNLSGGLKAKGHPVGATGVAQIVAVTRLLRGDHPRSPDIPTPKIGVAHNAGGTVASATVHVLEEVSDE